MSGQPISIKERNSSIKGVCQLLKKSWQIYCSKIKSLLAIMSFPVGFSFLFWVLIYFLADTPLKYSIWFSVMEGISFLGSFFLWLWAIPSLLYNLKEKTSIKESYKGGFKILGSYIWVYFLLTIIIAGGFFLFIIPGILFSIWFSLAIFILVFEKRRGFDALFKSKHLVKGKFWQVFLRFLVLGLIIGLGIFLVSASIFFGIENRQIGNQISEVVDYFIQLFVLPFFLIYGFLIYSNLKEIKAGVIYKESARNKKIKYVIPGILGILIVGLLISISFFNIFWGRDIPPIDDNDLWLSKIEIPKEENAFYPLAQVSEKIYLPKEKSELFTKMVRGEKWDSEFAEELIKNNAETFDNFEKVIKSPYFQIPTLQDPKTLWTGTSMISLRRLREIAYLNSIKAAYIFRQGEEKEAFDQTIKIIKMGQMLEDSPRPALIGYLVGMAIKEVGLERLRLILPRATLPPKILRDYINKLDKFKLNEKGLVNVFKMGYIEFSNTKAKIDAGLAGKVSKKEMGQLEEIPFQEKAAMTRLTYLYKPNQTQRMFAEYYRNSVNNADKSYYCEMEFPEIRPLAPSSRIKWIFTENIVGKIFHDIFAVTFSSVFEKKCLEDFSVSGTQLLIAMKAYQIDNSELPNSLDGLVPKYISEIPLDPFDGNPIRFSAEKRIIYSVGRDLKDSGGSKGEDWRIMEDPTFKIGP